MSLESQIVSSFVEGAPPGELTDVLADLKALTNDGVVQRLEPTLKKYNENQLTTVKFPGSSQPVLVSEYNSLGDNRYYDVETSTSFTFDHTTQKASAAQSYTHDSPHTDLIKSLLKSLSTHASEHYPSSTFSAFPSSDSDTITILLVSNKYSPTNFWNGRWRSIYHLSPSSSTLTGSIKVDVHYYEDGNVRLITDKPVSLTLSSTDASKIVREIAIVEKKVQEELNKGFASLSEGAFKGLRRQLPVTRQKVEWDKIAGYRLGQDIGGGARGVRS